MTSLQDVKKDYEDLANLAPDADAVAKRSRGFAFERLLNKLFTLDLLITGLRICRVKLRRRDSLAVNFVNSVSKVLSCGPASLYESLENLTQCTLALFIVL